MDYLHLPSQSALLIPPTAPQCCRCFNRRTVITVKCFPILNLCRAKFFPCCRNLALFPSLQQSRRGRPVLRKEFSKLPAKYSEQCLSPSHIPELSDWANWNFPVWPVDSPPVSAVTRLPNRDREGKIWKDSLTLILFFWLLIPNKAADFPRDLKETWAGDIKVQVSAPLPLNPPGVSVTWVQIGCRVTARRGGREEGGFHH